MTPSPPKPWEIAGAGQTQTDAQEAHATLSGTDDVPELPVRPAPGIGMAGSSAMAARPGFGSPYSRFGTGYGANGYNSMYGNTTYNSGYGTTGYTSAYGNTGYNSGYGSGYGTGYSSGYSPYSRFGNTYGGGGYGAGGYGVGGYGAGGYGAGYGRFGPNGVNGPNDPEAPLTARLEQSTQATFQTLDQVVQAFGGFAQMLDSTLMATHSSFMAMAGVAEQLGHFRHYFGQILSAISIISTVRDLFGRLTGRYRLGVGRSDQDAGLITPGEFEAFSSGKGGDAAAATLNQNTGAIAAPKAAQSRRPIVVFLLMAIGLPWAISRLVAALERRRRAQGEVSTFQQQQQQPLLHPSQIRNLDFCRATHAFSTDASGDLALRPGDIVAVLSKTDPVTNQPSLWWHGRTQSGQVGIFPSNYVEVIKKRDATSNDITPTTPTHSNLANAATFSQSLSPSRNAKMGSSAPRNLADEFTG